MSFAFSPDPDQLPRPADPERMERGLERFHDAADASDDPAVSAVVKELAEDQTMQALLAGVFGNSSFLGQCLVRDIAFVPAIFNGGFDHAFESVMHDLAIFDPAASFTDTGMTLRRAKRRIALLTALADLSSNWPLATVTERLSQFCGAALSNAIRHLLTTEHARGRLQLPDMESPETGSGYIVLGMGKLGAFELNYSSDIDLIVLYDQDVVPAADPDELQQNLVRLTRDLVKLMDERTGEGYVFRTDLRLRPDPGATPVAMSTFAAETYYESQGQNWERAAMIKARPVAGDIEAGYRFLETLQPFVWRRHLDFAAIEDIQSIKRQIHAHKGGSTVAIAGHNVKLGRGGIREVEFFTQTQQLIWGGRDPDLRSPFTVQSIEALVTAERVTRLSQTDGQLPRQVTLIHEARAGRIFFDRLVPAIKPFDDPEPSPKGDAVLLDQKIVPLLRLAALIKTAPCIAEPEVSITVEFADPPDPSNTIRINADRGGLPHLRSVRPWAPRLAPNQPGRGRQRQTRHTYGSQRSTPYSLAHPAPQEAIFVAVRLRFLSSGRPAGDAHVEGK